jgi:neutral ceramidase
LENSNLNRSPTSYLANPESERRKYPDGDVDKDLHVLRFEDEV